MALGQTLRYYRGQFNPESAYQPSGDGSTIISLYNPESQARFIEAVAQRQERFDTAKLAEAQELARIGELETYDLPELNNRLKSFESNINNLVKTKYNGDYGAAANEIAKMIGTERSNPFYHFNKQKVEMSKAYLDAKMKLGSNFMSANNPMEVGFQDWQKGAKFDFTPINREDIVKDAAMEFGTLADTIMSDPTLQSTAGGQYFLSTIQSGLEDPRAVREFMETEEGQIMIQNIVDKNPELSKLDREQVMGAVTEGAYSAIGKTQTQYLQNQDFISRADLLKASGEVEDSYFNLMIPTGAMATKKYFEGVDEKGNRLSAIRSYSINSTSSTRMTTSQINELDNIKKNLGSQIKLLAFGDKPSELVNFMNKKSRKNIEQMDGKEPVEITDVGFSPNTSELVLGITGYDKEGKMLEAGLVLDAGTEETYPNNNRILALIPYLETLGEQGSDFNRELYTWLARNYPSMYKQYTNQ